MLTNMGSPYIEALGQYPWVYYIVLALCSDDAPNAVETATGLSDDLAMRGNITYKMLLDWRDRGFTAPGVSNNVAQVNAQVENNFHKTLARKAKNQRALKRRL